MTTEDQKPFENVEDYSFAEDAPDPFLERARELFENVPRDEQTIREMNTYRADLRKRAEKLLASMQAQLFRLHRKLEELMDDAEFDEAIREHFKTKGEKEEPPWNNERIEEEIKTSKQCFVQSMHGEVLSNIAFQAAVKTEHHKDVANAIFFSTFFSYLTDPSIRKHAMNKARSILLKEGYSGEQIDKTFGRMAPVSIHPIKRKIKGKLSKEERDQIVGFGLENAGVWSQTWNLIKHSEQNNVKDIINNLHAKTGIPQHILSKKVLEVGNTIEMLHGLPSNIGSRLSQQARNIMSGFKTKTNVEIEEATRGVVGISDKQVPQVIKDNDEGAKNTLSRVKADKENTLVMSDRRGGKPHLEIVKNTNSDAPLEHSPDDNPENTGPRM